MVRGQVSAGLFLAIINFQPLKLSGFLSYAPPRIAQSGNNPKVYSASSSFFTVRSAPLFIAQHYVREKTVRSLAKAVEGEGEEVECFDEDQGITYLLPPLLSMIASLLLPQMGKSAKFAISGLIVAAMAFRKHFWSKAKRRSGLGVALLSTKGEKCIYLDYNATTPVYPEVAEAMKPYLFGSCFGNPSSSHPYGQGCREGLDRARRRVAALVGARPAEIYFTSCGSESDHWAVESGIRAGALARGLQGKKPHAVACNVEHYAIFKCLDRLQARGEIDVTYVPVDARGLAAPAAVAAAVTGRTALVTVMHAQNEVGALQDVKAIASKVHRIDPRILVHTDAAQSVGKVPVKAEQLGVDLLTLAGHKFGAPKGVAALYCRRGIDLEPVILGAKQEFGKRAGTENVALAVALGMAAQLADAELPRAQQHMAALRDRLERALVAGLPPGLVRVHGPTEAHQRLPNTLSVGFRGVKAPELKAALDPVVACSAGAACGGAGNAVALSPTLAAMGVPEEYGLGTLRLSLGRHSTEDEIDRAAKYIINAVKKLLSVP